MAINNTDIACEIYSKHCKNLPQGVYVSEMVSRGIHFTKVDITKSGLRREKGTYMTFDMQNLMQVHTKDEEFVCAIASQLRKFLPQKGAALVVGVGNRAVVPDLLGPATADKVFVTQGDDISSLPLRKVAAVSPGVAGSTGVDTTSIIKGIISEIKPACAILVDSLCTSSPTRMGASVQISNTGLKPKNTENMCAKTLGVPIIAIGVPTVYNMPLPCTNKAVTVTPKDIDTIIQKASELLALAINKALQPALSVGEICFLTS